MKVKYLSILLLLFTHLCFSQKTTVENSLKKAQLYFDFPKDSLLFYSNFVIKNAKNDIDKALAHHYLGNTYKINGNLNLALKNYQIENALFKKLID